MTARDIVMGAAGNSGDSKTYIEDVFSTYLYTGNATARSIQNGIDLAGKGGMTWIKWRSGGVGYGDHELYDTVRGAPYAVSSNSTAAQTSRTGGLTSFNSDGFSLGTYGYENGDGSNLASWTFRKAPKFFDVVTYTGNGSASKTISHSLGQAPGMIIVKNTSTSYPWLVYQRSVNGGVNPQNYYLLLNDTQAQTANSSVWNNTAPTDSSFTVGSLLNTSGENYVAYLFAHDTTTDGLIQCGSFTSTGPLEVNLGWEPQYVMIKAVDNADDWFIFDTMRGESYTTNQILKANTSGAETSGGAMNWATPTATGFKGDVYGTGGTTYIYMAIRRGPMKTPTDGTKVFKPSKFSSAGTPRTVDTGFPVDLSIFTNYSTAYSPNWMDRLRGFVQDRYTVLYSNNNDAEANGSSTSAWVSSQYNTGIVDKSWSSSGPAIYWNFQRAPGFFDVVCYTGNGTYAAKKHNLGVAPELVIAKKRNSSSYGNWYVQVQPQNIQLYLNTSDAQMVTGVSTPTATTWYPQQDSGGDTFVAYLFASCPGVSKVGSYTGNGSSQTINCGFTNGARFFLVKATSTTGSWWVYDSARGIVAAADPALQLNSAAAEVTSADAVDPDATGIIVNQEATCSINANGVSYIYLAIA